MDDLDRREAFLLAVFTAPADDLPRLVYADFLEERGETDAAHHIRSECARQDQIPETVRHLRGFHLDSRITVAADLLATPDEFRRVALVEHPEWYGCDELKVKGGLIASSKPVSTILHSPVTQRVTKLDLSGLVVDHVMLSDEAGVTVGEFSPLHDFEYQAVVTLQAVEALVGARECRRFTHLDLTNNDLDNDAARAIVRSNFLTRLVSLRLFDNNQLRGKTWAQLQAKFGEAVLS